MTGIVYDARKIMVYESLEYLCKLTGKEEGFLDTLWNEILDKPSLYEEVLYYLDNKSVMDKLDVNGYTLTDVCVYMLKHYNLVKDTGKITEGHDKELLMLDTFMFMANLMNEPEKYSKKLEIDNGMDFM